MAFAVLTKNVWICFITPLLDERQPYIVAIHIGCNEITHSNVDNIGVKNIALFIGQVNDFLREE